MLVVIMLNPSTADADRNDPTILALIDFATRWGFGGVMIVNQYAFRSSQPADLLSAADPVGPLNWFYLFEAIDYARQSGWALAAWGNGGNRPDIVYDWCDSLGVELKCLGVTQSSAPKHPLARGLHRIPRDQQPLPWRAPV